MLTVHLDSEQRFVLEAGDQLSIAGELGAKPFDHRKRGIDLKTRSRFGEKDLARPSSPELLEEQMSRKTPGKLLRQPQGSYARSRSKGMRVARTAGPVQPVGVPFGAIPLALIPAISCGAHDCADQTRLSLLQSALAVATERRALRALSDEEVFVAAGAEISHHIRACGPELTCICSAASSVPAELLLVLRASLDEDRPVLGLRLIDRNACRIVGQAVREPSKHDDLARAVEVLAAEVLEKAGFPRFGRVRFVLEPKDALVAPDEGMRAEAGDPTFFATSAGVHKVSVSAPGFVAQSVDVALASEEEKSVRIELERERSIAESPWLWIGVGVAAIAAVAGTVVWLNRPEVVCVPPAGMNCTE